MATLGGADGLGRGGELGTLTPGAVADVVVWDLEGVAYAGAVADPIEAWLRCGPTGARDTVVNGRHVVRDRRLVSPRVPEMLAAHRAEALRIQRLAG